MKNKLFKLSIEGMSIEQIHEDIICLDIDGCQSVSLSKKQLELFIDSWIEFYKDEWQFL